MTENENQNEQYGDYTDIESSQPGERFDTDIIESLREKLEAVGVVNSDSSDRTQQNVGQQAEQRTKNDNNRRDQGDHNNEQDIEPQNEPVNPFADTEVFNDYTLQISQKFDTVKSRLVLFNNDPQNNNKLAGRMAEEITQGAMLLDELRGKLSSLSNIETGHWQNRVSGIEHELELQIQTAHRMSSELRQTPADELPDHIRQNLRPQLVQLQNTTQSTLQGATEYNSEQEYPEQSEAVQNVESQPTDHETSVNVTPETTSIIQRIRQKVADAKVIVLDAVNKAKEAFERAKERIRNSNLPDEIKRKLPQAEKLFKFSATATGIGGLVYLGSMGLGNVAHAKDVDPSELVRKAQEGSGVPVPGGGTEAEGLAEHAELIADEVGDAGGLAGEAIAGLGSGFATLAAYMVNHSLEELCIILILGAIGGFTGYKTATGRFSIDEISKGIPGFIISGEVLRIATAALSPFSPNIILTTIAAGAYSYIRIRQHNKRYGRGSTRSRRGRRGPSGRRRRP
jgi:hypothetical protein